MATNNRKQTTPLEWFAIIGGGYVLLQLFGPDKDDPKPPGDPPIIIDDSKPTWSRQVYIDTADALDVELFEYFIEDENEVRRLIGKMRTTNDVQQLIYFYGSRFHVWPLGTWTLAEALQYFLDQDQLHAINMMMAGKGINYRF